MTLGKDQLDAMPVGSKVRGFELGFSGDNGKRMHTKILCEDCRQTRWYLKHKLLVPETCGACNKKRNMGFTI